MSSVDNRLVKMTFDNEDFEKKASSTLGILDKLKQSLNFSGALKGVEDIKARADGVTFDAMSSGIEALQNRFSVLGEFVHNTFENIITKAADVGRSLAESVTITPMKEGFSEYELQMNSVQTIMASTGESVDTVNKYLNELNEYADKTIYSFSDMTQNIGKFTNAGVSLDSAVQAIQGVSNVAAVSGANTNEASRAMYNFAQALSAGAVKLIDWKSIENANMATVEFKQSLIDTAVAMGTLTKDGDNYISTTTDLKGEVSDAFQATKGFNESLSHQWMTTDVLVQTLSQYSTDIRTMSKEERAAYEEKLRGLGYTEEQIKAIEELGKKAADSAKDVKTFSQLIDTTKEALGSGWTQSWQYIFGDLEQAKKLWTEISDIVGGYINKSADARNDVLKSWSDSGGRIAVIDGLRNAFQALVSVMEPIKKAWDQAFPPLRAKTLIDLSNKFRDFTEGLKLTNEESTHLADVMKIIFDDLRNAYEGIKSIAKTIYSIFKTIGEGIHEAFGESYVANIGMITSRIREFGDAIKPSEATLANLKRLVVGLSSVLKALIHIAVDAGSAIFDSLGNIFNRLAPDGENFMKMLGDLGDRLKDFSEKLSNTFNFDAFSGGFTSISNAFVNLFQIIRDGVDIPGILSKIFDYIFGIDFSGITNFINNIADGASNVTDVLHNIVKAIAGLFGGEGDGGIFAKVIDAVQKFASKINWDAIFNVLKHIESFVAAKALLKMAKFLEDLPESLGGLIDMIKTTPVDKVSGLLDSIKDSFESWQKNLKALVLIEIGVALITIAKALKTLSEISPDRIGSSLGAMAGGLAEVIIATKFLKKSKVGEIADLWGLSQIIEKIANAMKTISDIQPDRLIPSAIAMGALLIEVAIMLRILNGTEFRSDNTMNTAVMLFVLAKAMESLGKTLERLSKIPWDKMLIGLGGITVLMTELVVAINFMPTKDTGKLFAAAAALILIAEAIRLLVKAVDKLGSLPIDTLVKGLVAVGILLAEMAAALRLMPTENAGKLLVEGAALILVATAIRIIAGAVEKVGSLPIDAMVKGLAAVGVLLAEMVAALRFMPNSASVIAAAFAMDLMAIAINGLVGPVQKLGSMNLESLAKGLGGIGALLAEIVLALRFMPKEGELLAASIAMNAIAMAINSLVGPIDKFASMDTAQLAQGLIAVGIALGEIVIAMRLMPKETETLASSAAMIGMAIALNLLAGPLERLGQMNLGELLTSLAAMGGALFILAVAAEVFANIQGLGGAVVAMMGMGVAIALLAPALLLLSQIQIGGLLIALGALAGTFVIFGIAAQALTPSVGVIIAFAAAVALTGVGLFALAAAIGLITDVINNSTESMSQNLSVFLQALIDNVPLFGQLVTDTLNQIYQTIIDTSPKLAEAVNATILAVLNVIVTTGPEIIRTLLELLTQLLESIAAYAPRMFEAALTFVQSFLQAIADHIGDIVKAAVDIILNFIRGIIDKLPDIIDTAFKMVIGFIDGLATAIEQNHMALFNAVGHLISAIVGAIIDGISMVANAGAKLIVGENGNGGIIGAIGRFFNDLYNAGANLVQGFIDGILSMPGRIWDAACDVANRAWDAITSTLDEHSPSRLTFGGGENFVLGFVNGIISLKDKAATTAAAVAYAAMQAFDDNIDTDSIYSPTITPVIDASELQNGIGDVTNLFDNLPETYNITSDIAANNAARKQIYDVIGQPSDYSSIISRMDALEQSFNSMIDKLGDLSIIMDSGELVGAISPSIDNALGMRQTMFQRGAL